MLFFYLLSFCVLVVTGVHTCAYFPFRAFAVEHHFTLAKVHFFLFNLIYLFFTYSLYILLTFPPTILPLSPSPVAGKESH